MSRRVMSLLVALLVVAGLPAALRFAGATPPPAAAQARVTQDSWADDTALPQARKRAVAVAYPPNGKIYLLGGRGYFDRSAMDGEDRAMHNIYEYSPGSPGSWARKTAQLPYKATVRPGGALGEGGQTYTANMAAAVLTGPSGPGIYLLGGNNLSSVPTMTMSIYFPSSDTITVSGTDPWPASPARLPGGWAVSNNKLYVFGGFNGGTAAVYGDTWVFDPLAAVGSRWTQLTARLSVPRAYIAGAALDGYLYAVGGDTYTPGAPPTGPNGTLVPVTTVERLDLSAATPAWSAVTSLPTALGDMGAWAMPSGSPNVLAGTLVIAGGGWYTPTVSTYQYHPARSSWTALSDLGHATRNYGAAQLGNTLYAIGGYQIGATGQPDGATFVQAYAARPVVLPPTATATASATTVPGATSTNTPLPAATATPAPPSATATPAPPTVTPVAVFPSPTTGICVAPFTDVQPSDYFYAGVNYLYCHNSGVISGYSDGTFRPYNNVTRAQATKIVVLAFGLPIYTPARSTFSDVPATNVFYPFIETAAQAGIVSGYSDGTFQPSSPVTRGQLTKITVRTAGWPVSSSPNQTFSDVPATNVFFHYIETAVAQGIISGYNDGTFHPAAPVTRGQTAKIVYGAVAP
ncbi:MAG: S-layer homology domain-containing protein [Chloroflexota bacterium]|nr:S-layer homology domain-containing protein [Chloroflexota bacterium]